MFEWLFHYFTDAVLRGPTLASMLMCISAALIGVIVVLRKQSLVGEMLSHCAYPGVFLGIIVAAAIFDELLLPSTIFVGALVSSCLGLAAVLFLQQRFRIHGDSALCFVLSAFFGIGITLGSGLQFTHASLYRQGQAYLFGQAATMTDWHILLYSLLVFFLGLFLILFFKEIQLGIFNRDFAITIGLPVRWIDSVTYFLIAFAIIIGLQSVGVVLMSAMLIAPAVAARQFTQSLMKMFLLAALIGAFSALLGIIISVEWTKWFWTNSLAERMVLPTGPAIVLSATAICITSLLFAPERGWIVRLLRSARFRSECVQENILKALWRKGAGTASSLSEIAQGQSLAKFRALWYLRKLVRNGFMRAAAKGGYALTHDGWYRAAKIVRLHRLWEVYLADYVGVGSEKVHRSAEEMEHILTPEFEERLTVLLQNPSEDPHSQPIPPRNLF